MTKQEKAVLDIEKRLELSSDRVKRNTVIVTPDDLKQDYVLHIAIKSKTTFVPHISKIAAHSEDNTLPRVHTAPSLLGCIIGFSSSEYLATNFIPNDSNKDKNKYQDPTVEDPYLGGMYIHKLKFIAALKPNKKLVFDSEDTGEVWLICYDEDTRKYTAEVSGKLVISRIEYEPVVGDYPARTVVFMAEITDSDGLMLDNETKLTKGYWSISVETTGNKAKAEKISKAIFDKDRTKKAALLSMETRKPLSSLYSW